MSEKNPVKKWRELRRQLRRASNPEEKAFWERALKDFERLMSPKQLEIVRAEYSGDVRYYDT